MSLLLSRLSRLCHEKHASVRSSLLRILSNGFSTSLLQTPPCSIIAIKYCGPVLGKLIIGNANETVATILEKKVPRELNNRHQNSLVMIGASHGWIATMKEDGILRLQDDLNPVASDTEPKRISLPPLVTLPCQFHIVTNVSMSTSSPEDEDCVVAVKFKGPQLSFCRPAHSNSEWTNIRIQNPCFYRSRVVYSKKDDMFRLLGSGGHLIASWDLGKHMHTPKLQELRFHNLPELTNTKRELLDSCCLSEHLVESESTGETFLVKLYKKTAEVIDGVATKRQTEALMVFKLDEEGNAVYTEDIGDLSIFISESEPFTVPAISFPGMVPNFVHILDFNEIAFLNLTGDAVISKNGKLLIPYHIPPQNITH